MTNRPQIGIVLPVLVLALAACSDSSSSWTAPAPLAPSPPPTRPSDPPSFPPAGYTLSNVTLSGVVFEDTLNGRAPIEAVSVYCELCGAETHTWTSTDSNGFYEFIGVWTSGINATPVLVRKDGYIDPVGLPKLTNPGWREVVVNGDTQFDMQLVRR